MKPTKAILLLNLGGPETLDKVKPFLFRLFADPEIIRIPFTPLRYFVAWMISTLREKKSQELYQSIGGGSPIRKLTDDQARQLETLIQREDSQVVVRTAFTCSDPLVEDVVKELAQQGVTSFLSLPLYPQYSYTTTKSSLDRVRAAVKKYAPGAQLEEVSSYPDHPQFIEAHADLIRQQAVQFPQADSRQIYLLFSAHSIPEKLVTELGDPYKKEMELTVEAVVKKLDWKGPYSLAWQSKLGPVKWLAPGTMDVIAEQGKKGTKQILVVPIAFVTDHIETLEEIDHEMRHEAEEHGMVFRRALGLNSHPAFIASLADIARRKKGFWS